MQYAKNTKIIATIGPASLEEPRLEAMLRAGMNVARLNFSHSEHPWHKNAIHMLRTASRRTRIPLAILADLQGPRIRTIVAEPLDIVEGDEVVFYEKTEKPDEKRKSIGIDQPGILEQLKVGQVILVEDGKHRFEIFETQGNICVTKALQSSVINNHKGMNFPNANLTLSSLTEKDKADLEFALGERVEYIGLSFVGSRQNVEELRELIKPSIVLGEYEPEVVVKIERQEAIRNLDEIIDATDVVMVARGDLAVEAGASRVAVYQKTIIKKCLAKTKPVIVATQMLESMMTNLQPTRAEISDVSNAVIDHTDATMLSGETAGGKYPVECVKMMADIIRDTEESTLDDIVKLLETSVQSKYIHVIRGVYRLSQIEGVSAILVVTHSGVTARLLSHFRPKVPMYVVTPREDVYRKLALLWGVRPYFVPEATTGKEADERGTVRAFEKQLVAEGLLREGDQVVSVFRTAGEQTKTVELRERGI